MIPLSFLPGRLLFEQGLGAWMQPSTALDLSDITAMREFVDRYAESDTQKAVIYGLIDTISEIMDRIAVTEQAKGNTAALPFKQEIAAPLEELEELLAEMRGGK